MVLPAALQGSTFVQSVTTGEGTIIFTLAQPQCKLGKFQGEQWMATKIQPRHGGNV